MKLSEAGRIQLPGFPLAKYRREIWLEPMHASLLSSTHFVSQPLEELAHTVNNIAICAYEIKGSPLRKRGCSWHDPPGATSCPAQ